MMGEFWIAAGMALVFLAAFLLSLFHASLSTYSKISLSRLLEDKEKEDRQRILDLYDETRLAVESWRVVLIIVFFIYLVALVPRGRLWPIWFCLVSLSIYFFLFDYAPRLLNSLDKKAVIKAFLPSFPIVHQLAMPMISLIRRLEKKQIEEELREATEEEIETFIDEATEEGIIEENEGDLLKSVVEFGDTLVREIMTPRGEMVCIKRSATFGDLRELVLKEKYSRIPVYKDRIDNIEGLVIAKDLLAYANPEYGDRSIEPIIRPVFFVPESMKVSRLLGEFQKRKLKLAVVVDEHGGVSGLVTMEDLVEEIVGEIQDEYDQDEEAPITAVGPTEFLVSGEVSVEEVEKLFDLDLAKNDFITASGFISHQLGRLPDRGEILSLQGLTIEIVDVDQTKIKKVRIKRAAESESRESG